jgi:hypothetical protein
MAAKNFSSLINLAWIFSVCAWVHSHYFHSCCFAAFAFSMRLLLTTGDEKIPHWSIWRTVEQKTQGATSV